jgi:hypothetical protein
MGRSTVIAAAALSVQDLLNRGFAELDTADPNAFRARPRARLVRTDDFGEIGAANSPVRYPVLSIFCYRVDVDRTVRSPPGANPPHPSHPSHPTHPPLDVHLLLTPWDRDPDAELSILGAAMQCLDGSPILTGPLRHRLGDWQPGEVVQLEHEDLPTEEVLRIFDALPCYFRVSVSYRARIAG